MCGIMQGSSCRFAELTPGQFGLTKQLVLRIALPHITLLFVSICYAFLGSIVLTAVRKNDEDLKPNFALKSAQRTFSASLQQMDANHSKAFDDFAAKLYDMFLQNPKINNPPEERTVVLGAFSARSLFFTATALTSIGYGADSPSTFAGRLFCIFYLFFGIPLYLITLADTAKFCTELMNRAYTEYLKWKFRVRRQFKRWRAGSARKDSLAGGIGHVIIAGGDDEVAEFLWTHLEATQFVEVPFLLVYTLLLTYIAISSSIVARVEGWSLGDGFYFIMMSVLTVGFGDVVPRSEEFALLHLIVVLFGLVLTTTSIDIVGAYYIDRLHFFGRTLDNDPLSWLKAVQQKRIEAMKREAMRKLFETVTALHHLRFTTMQKLMENAAMDRKCSLDGGIRLPNAPEPPTHLTSFNATADSVCLRWKAPGFTEEGKRFWYTLTYKTRNPHVNGRNTATVVDFINGESYEVKGLKSFTLYQFSLVTTTRFGSSKPVRCQEYTEPCTVPQSLRVDAVSCETVTLSWRSPNKNNGHESYVIQFSQEPAPQFTYWSRFRCGASTKFTITDLSPDTRYIACVSAEHNYGLAAMSKSVRFVTRRWWNEDDKEGHLFAPLHLAQQRLSIISSISAAPSSNLR